MNGMNGGHGSMGGMTMPPASSTMNSTTPTSNMSSMPHHHLMMTHMTFFWGKNAEILFKGWPGTSAGMYALSLIVVFGLSVLVEWLSRWQVVKQGTNDVVAGIILTFTHAVRMGLAYLVMLAVMSFNGGVFLVAVAGHAVGFLVFGTRVFRKGGGGGGGGGGVQSYKYEKTSDLPSLSC